MADTGGDTGGFGGLGMGGFGGPSGEGGLGFGGGYSEGGYGGNGMYEGSLDETKTDIQKPRGALSYGIEGFLKGLATGSPTGAILGGLIGTGIGLAKNYSPSEAQSMSDAGVGMVADKTTGGFYRADELGLKDVTGVHIVETDAAGKIANYVGSDQTGNVRDIITSGTGSPGADIQASYEQQGLDYLIDRDRLPKQYSEGALNQLGGVYGLPGGTGSQQDVIERAIASPLYGAIMGGQKAGEDAIIRNAAATGGLRSGNVQSNMYDYNTQLENRALLESYNQQIQGLTGMAGLPSMATNIAQQTSNIGQTIGQGLTANQQMQADQKQNNINNLMGLGNLGMSIFGMFSDRRLKTNIKYLFSKNGHNIYSWDWNKIAQKMGMTGSSLGCMAEEVYAKCKEAVLIKNHFMFIDYSKLDLVKLTM